MSDPKKIVLAYSGGLTLPSFEMAAGNLQTDIITYIADA